ncbi:DUF1161 domain-containing protein [Proteus myxofaciens]|uniref:Putative outer membrane protein n=1 Tax=Proteus myxofaciens ATCC 19692 TaxID=1354337 RepID=A0A198GRG2_9GAMM|nr:DUF1161 domain-containing protein [Proteus myxofaciens]OAT39465.1 putative outer membrane protein [Proteus myxofaciens ATCC 19692]
MKKYLLLTMVAMFTFAPLAANASCDEVVETIQQTIINNGVPVENFTLTVVDNDNAEQSEGKVVGNCENNTKKIVYTRH